MTRIVSIFFLISLSFSAVAQDDTMKVSSLEEVVFTANKYPKKQSETGKVITVITREQLDHAGGKTISEILNNVTGTTIVNSNGNLGSNMTANIRGGSAGNVLILLNGIPVNDPSVITNYFDLNFIATDQVERIEVLKGGQSTLYGSDAVTGVINIITRKSGPAGKHIDISAAAGSYGTFKGNVGLRQTSSKSQFSLGYGITTSNGFSSAHDPTGSAGYDKDGFTEHNITGTWQVSLTNKLKANLIGQYSRYKTDIDYSAFTDDGDYKITTSNVVAGAGLGYDIGNGSLQFNYRFNQVKRLYQNDSLKGSNEYLHQTYEGNTHYLELYGNKKWDHVEVLAGVDYRNNKISSDLLSISSFGPYTSSLSDSLANMSQISPYASVILKANSVFNIELGGRMNHHSKYGDNFSYTINPSVLINGKTKIFVNVYSAFKAPTLFQLFDPSIGNVDLDPEESVNIELGTQLALADKLTFRGVYFYRNTKDAIDFIDTDPVFFVGHYENVSKRKASGVEVELDYKGERWTASANYTHVKGTQKSMYDNTGVTTGKEVTTNNLFRTPADVFNVNAGLWITDKLYGSTTLRIAGNRLEPIYGSMPRKLARYYTLDIYGEYKIKSNFRLFADFRNLTDQEYFETLGYNTRGFNVMGGIRVSF